MSDSITDDPLSVKKMSTSTLAKCVKFANVATACGLIAAVALFFLTITVGDEDSQPTNMVASVLAAIYVSFFSLMLLMFELHLKSMDKSIFQLFGFMFSWYGRGAFLFFVGTLAFSLGVPGYIAGGVACVVVVFNIYALHFNKEYKQYVIAQGAASKLGAEKAVLQEAEMGVFSGGHATSGASGGGGAAVGGAGGAGNPQGKDWERFHDEETDSYYFYNHKTKETRWENPE